MKARQSRPTIRNTQVKNRIAYFFRIIISFKKNIVYQLLVRLGSIANSVKYQIYEIGSTRISYKIL